MNYYCMIGCNISGFLTFNILKPFLITLYKIKQDNSIVFLNSDNYDSYISIIYFQLTQLFLSK